MEEAELDQKVPEEKEALSAPRFVIFNEACEHFAVLNERVTIFRRAKKYFLLTFE